VSKNGQTPVCRKIGGRCSTAQPARATDHAVKSYAIEDELAEFGDRLNFQPDVSAADPPF